MRGSMPASTADAVDGHETRRKAQFTLPGPVCSVLDMGDRAEDAQTLPRLRSVKAGGR
jgi:hypothetical protein